MCLWTKEAYGRADVSGVPVSEGVGGIMSVNKWIDILINVITVVSLTLFAAVICSFILWMAVAMFKMIWGWILF